MGSGEPDITGHPREKDIENECQTSSTFVIDTEQESQSPKESFVERGQVVIGGERESQSPTVSSVDKSQVVIDSDHDSETPSVSSVDKSQEEIDGEDCQIPRVSNVSKFEMDVAGEQEYTCYRQGYRPTKYNSNVRKSRQETRTGCLAHMTIARQPNGKFRVTHFETKHNHDGEPDITGHPREKDIENECQTSSTFVIDTEQESQSPKESFVEQGQVVIGGERESQSPTVSSVDKSQVVIDSDHDSETPSVSSVDKSQEEIDGEDCQIPRVSNVSKFEMDVAGEQEYTCYRQGYRPTKYNSNVRKSRQETRTGCLAHMTIARQPNGKFRVTHFETKHNHEFVTPSTAHKKLFSFGYSMLEIGLSDAADDHLQSEM
ncbi:hypothetical protein CFP56_010306, partial [Quercus suber]